MDANKIIDGLGGTNAAAALCEVNAAAVSQWRKRGFIPPARLLFLKAVRPKLFAPSKQVRKGRKVEERKAGGE